MSTSGVYTFTINRNELIKQAYDEIGALEEGEDPTADEINNAAMKLNLMIKTWVAQGYHLWCVQDAVLFQVLSQTQYSLGGSSTDAEWCDPDDYVSTTLSAAAIAGASTLTVTSITGLANADRIGVLLDSGNLQWTTINGAPSGSTVTLTAVLTGAAASGNRIFVYTSRLVRPLRIIPGTIYRRDINSNDTPIELEGKRNYTELTSKTQSGKTIKVIYEPFLTSGTLWVWPTADLATDTIRFSYERPIQDFSLLTDNPDFPIEWGEAIYKNLALRLAPSQGALQELAYLKPAADEALMIALDFDRENVSIRFMPDMRSYSFGRASRRW